MSGREDSNGAEREHIAFWDRAWADPAGRADWLRPEIAVQATAHAAYNSGARTALDLGCGLGRHALLLAEIGFETHALDASARGLAHLRAAAEDQGLEIDSRQGRMTALPYPDASFDYVLAYDVIHRGDGEVVRQAVSEIARVLKPRALFHGTLLSKRNSGFGVGEETTTDAWAAAGETGPGHPQFYCDAAGLVGLFAGFELWSLEDRPHAASGDWHWHLTAERLG